MNPLATLQNSRSQYAAITNPSLSHFLYLSPKPIQASNLCFGKRAPRAKLNWVSGNLVSGFKPSPSQLSRIKEILGQTVLQWPKRWKKGKEIISRQEIMNCKNGAIPHRLAVVTGANKGVGLEVARQLAISGVAVILTARDEKRGTYAVESLCRESNLSNIVFHQLDVCDPISIATLTSYIQSQYGKLDILVNNAAIVGVSVDIEGLRALNIDAQTWTSGKATNLIQGVIHQTYDEAVACLNTNYYGCKRVTEALLPLLNLSTSGARIVNTSSLASELKRMPNETLRNKLSNIDAMNEEKIEETLTGFLDDVKNGRLEEAGWPMMLPAYSVSKMVLNVYTRILAKRYPEMCINCVRPGFVKTDINWNTGILTPEEGARGPVMLALLPEGGPTGCYFDQTNLTQVW